ncbi:MAG: hypothetical protein FWD85_03905 [Microbacteriaceae bacterium]|nr:hypothetical protein [Microbacteriaceae bacterium]
MRNERHFWLTIAVAALPFTYIPHEIMRSGPNIAPLSLGFAILLGFRYRIWKQKLASLEVVSILFGLWIGLRLTVLAVLAHETVSWWQAASDISPLIAGCAIFRIASRTELRGPIVRGLFAALIFLIGFEVYQILAGVGRLQSLGYLAPLFNYYTQSGAMRPFSTLLSPTVFAAYLATLAPVVIVTAKTRLRVLLTTIAVVIGLAATSTRAAWIAFAVGGTFCCCSCRLPRKNVFCHSSHLLHSFR